MITVKFLHPASGGELTLQLPRDTRFSALTALLYDRKFVEPQKPGYRFLYQEHLCGTQHMLGDYIPESAGEIVLKVFNVPYVI